MSYIKIANLEEKYDGTITPINNNVIEVRNVPKSLDGFCLYNDKNDKLIGDYSEYTTLYKIVDEENNIYQYSNNDSEYTPLKYVVQFYANIGGILEGDTKQEVSNYEELEIPTVIADENYRFTGWYPEIPELGIINTNKTFSATFVYVPTLEEVKELKVINMNDVQQTVIKNGVDVTLSDGTVDINRTRPNFFNGIADKSCRR